MEQEDTIYNLVCEFEDQLVKDQDQLPLANTKPHTIVTGDEAPIFCPPYRLPKSHEDFVEKKLERMLKIELIVPSQPLGIPNCVGSKEEWQNLFMCELHYIESSNHY
ncbi:hypothetical protein DSO57_1028549 [Entomophthora muscae]|uniref:Uncharacterized protein n=1 Tax=Entomophthora muscae TaxID=34485 RepID=A0ACC2TD33_9FUNG|nr:hypothetical protein DSO57_1028549 [Entomophthora muscae]